jgi:hypothetical protein
MLHHLPHKADIPWWQGGLDDIQALEPDPIGAEGQVIVPDEAVDAIHADVSLAQAHQLPAAAANSSLWLAVCIPIERR